LAGAVFSHVARGFGVGLIGEHRLHPGPKRNEWISRSQTMITVRMDNTVTLPRIHRRQWRSFTRQGGRAIERDLVYRTDRRSIALTPHVGPSAMQRVCA